MKYKITPSVIQPPPPKSAEKPPPPPKLLMVVNPRSNQPPDSPPRKLPVNKRLPQSILQKFNSMLASKTPPPPTSRTPLATNPTVNKTGKQKLTKNSPITKRKADIKQKTITDIKNKKLCDSLKLWLSNEKTVPQVPHDEKKVTVNDEQSDYKPEYDS